MLPIGSGLSRTCNVKLQGPLGDACPSLRAMFRGKIMSKKILVVDDSKTALMMEREILERRTSYQCVTASDGREAVEKAQRERPDLVLMDVVMPHMNGFEACKMMRQQPTTREIPIVLVTTRGEEAYMEAGFQSG